VQRVCAWLKEHTISGVWRALQQLEIHWKRGRDYIHSPDPAYQAKLARIGHFKAMVREDPTHCILLFSDEVTYYRQPTLAMGYEEAGGKGPLARRSYRRNTATRVVATLNFLTGQVTYLQASRIGVRELVRFYEMLCSCYPWAHRIYLVQDNWPIHFHPDVLAALEPQQSPWPWNRPDNWRIKPNPKAKQLNLPIQILTLPTYASWTNPIEKLWRYLKQEVLHLHRLADDLLHLRHQVLSFLGQFDAGSDELLRYVGLLKPS